ncbi:hypothetical protein ILUMI_02507 [Ignelater luminosus]|uniref:Cytochrome P450 n=1 Tax=Ignelater luminosus TaxID=2038154 RepID=A0A8K0DI03_IGNLU|nr:hypothetical protein ILUMI_02507 [Ignelater luminosus]
MNAFLLLIVLVILFLFILIHKKVKKSLGYWKERGVPYVKPWPIFGNMSSVVFRKISFPNLLEEVYRLFYNNRYFGFYQFSTPTLIINDIDLIKQICIKEFDKFPDHADSLPKESDPFWNRGLFAMEGKDWHDMRTVLSPAFTSSKMKAMLHLMTECAEEFVEHFESQTSDLITLDMRDVFTRLTNDVIASCAFGFKCNSFRQQNNEFYETGKEAFDFSGFKGLKFFGSSISPTLMKMLKVTIFSKSLTNFFSRIVKETIQYREKRGLVRPDMIHLLREAQKGRLQNDSENSDYSINPFKTDSSKKTVITDEDIVCQAAIFFFGGYDTVGSLLCNLVYELALNPDIQDKLIEEVDETFDACNGKITYEALMGMKYLDMVISETLRLWTPATFLNRKCVKPFTIQPFIPGEKPLHIESGTECMIPAFAIHRDSRYFPNPNKFDPERFSDENKSRIQPFTYFPFGIGPRICIGNRFALLEIKTGIFYLLTRFKLVPVEKTSIPFVIDKSSIVLRHEHGYWLGLKRRSKAAA